MSDVLEFIWFIFKNKPGPEIKIKENPVNNKNENPERFTEWKLVVQNKFTIVDKVEGMPQFGVEYMSCDIYQRYDKVNKEYQVKRVRLNPWELPQIAGEPIVEAMVMKELKRREEEKSKKRRSFLGFKW